MKLTSTESVLFILVFQLLVLYLKSGHQIRSATRAFSKMSTTTPTPTPPHFRIPDPFKKDRDLIYKHIGFTKRITWNYQYFIIGTVFTYALIYNLTRLYKRIRRPRLLEIHFTHPAAYKWLRIWLISSPASTLLKSWFVSNANLLIISIYYAINLFVLLYKLPFDDAFNFALRSGLVAGSNLPLLYLFPLKNGPLLYLLNQSYENIIVFHKFIGGLVLGMSGLHMAGFVYTLNWQYAWIDSRSLTGFKSIFWFILIALTSGSFVRTRHYEVFKFVHHLSLFMFLPLFYRHHYVCKPFVAVIVICLAGDRLITWWSKLWCFQCTVDTKLGNELMLIRINTKIAQMPMPQRIMSYLLCKWNSSRFNHNLSNHLFITIPQISLMQAHPFTIASSPPRPPSPLSNYDDDDRLLLIVKIHKGFTSKLSQHALSNPDAPLTCFINGPYGNSSEHLPSIAGEDYRTSSSPQIVGLSDEHEPLIKMRSLKHYSVSSVTSLDCYRQVEKIVLIAGGAGVSLVYPMLSHYQDVDRFDVSFFWILRNKQDVVTFDNSLQRNLTIWHTSNSGRPNVVGMLNDSLDGNVYDQIHIIGCGPSGLMEETKRFATLKIKENHKINLVLEEFTF